MGTAEDEFIKAVGPLANGIMGNTSWWPSLKTPGNATFIKEYKARFNEDPDYHAAAGYAAIEELGAAVKATGSLDQAKLLAWLLHHKVSTVQGIFASDPNGAATEFGQDVFQIQNGVRKLIWPLAVAEAPAQFPYTGK